jgi:hypothetical protein
MLPLNGWKSDTTRKLSIEINNLLAFMDWAEPFARCWRLRPSIVSLESELRVLDTGELSREAEREGYQRVIEELHDRLEEAREQEKLWREVAEAFCQAHDIDFDPRDPDAMLIAAGECRDEG